MSTSCLSYSVNGMTIYNRSYWGENIDLPFLEMRDEGKLIELAKPLEEQICQDNGIGFHCRSSKGIICRDCDCCGAMICDRHSLISPTYNGERTRLCSRCQDKLAIPEQEIIALIHTYKNQRLFLPGRGSRSTDVPVTSSAARAVTLVSKNPNHTPPRSLFSRRKARAKDIDFPKKLRASSYSSDYSTFSTSTEILQITSEPGLDESQGAGTARNKSAKKVTFNKSRDMVTANVTQPYKREDDSLPWTTAHDVEDDTEGFLVRLLRFSTRSTMLEMAALAIGLVMAG